MQYICKQNQVFHFSNFWANAQNAFNQPMCWYLVYSFLYIHHFWSSANKTIDTQSQAYKLKSGRMIDSSFYRNLARRNQTVTVFVSFICLKTKTHSLWNKSIDGTIKMNFCVVQRRDACLYINTIASKQKSLWYDIDAVPICASFDTQSTSLWLTIQCFNN